MLKGLKGLQGHQGHKKTWDTWETGDCWRPMKPERAGALLQVRSQHLTEGLYPFHCDLCAPLAGAPETRAQ
jgi:hypothetical protein